VSSWAIISLPLVAAWKNWQNLRSKAIYELATSSEDVARLELRNKMIEGVKPVGHWNLMVSSAILAISFIAPIAKMVLR
jgi:hypothetical protein